MLFFKTRTLARNFAKKVEKYAVVDAGTDRAVGYRWGVRVL